MLDQVESCINDTSADLGLYILFNGILNETLSSFRNVSRSMTRTHTQEVIERAQQFIRDNCKQKLTNKAVANAMYLSEYHFIRQFMKYTSMTPYEYLLMHRLNLARQMLIEHRDLPVAAIAEEVGFPG